MQRAPKKQKQEDDLCGICITRKVTANIDCCRHQFCNTCIKGWVKGDNKSCPLCRQEVNLISSIKTGRILYKVRREMERPDVLVRLREQNYDVAFDPQIMQQDSEEQIMIQAERPIARPDNRIMFARRRQDNSLIISVGVAIIIAFLLIKLIFY